MPSDRRMISREIFESSVICRLASQSPGKQAESVIVFQTFIILADDQGRGRYLPSIIRSRAFAAMPDCLEKITLEDIQQWTDSLVEMGTLVIYEVKCVKYFALTGWALYQTGHKWKQPSKFPEPPSEYNHLFKKHPMSRNPVKQDCDEFAKGLPKDCDEFVPHKGIEKKEKKKKKDSDISEKTICRALFSSDSKFYIAAKTLFPDITDEKAIQKQAAVLEAIERLDQMPLEELLPILKWAKHNEFWKSVFLSCGKLRRKNDEVTMKWESMKAAFDRAHSKESDDSSSEPEPEEWTCPVCGISQKKFKSTSKCIHCGSEKQNG